MRASRFMAALAAVPLILGGFAGSAIADDISNNLDASVDAVAEVMPLTLDGAPGTTTLYLVTANNDGKNGCNLTGGTALTLSVASSNPAVATVSPSSVTFTGCSETKTLTVTPVGSGGATVSLSQASNTTAGTFNLAPATFSVTVAPPANTAPTVQLQGVTGGASYVVGDVPAATCAVTDAEDGTSSFPATLAPVSGPYAADGIGSQTAGCTYTDGGGLTAAASATYTIVDPTAPEISYTLDPATPTGASGWYKTDVAIDWTVTEEESPSSLDVTGCTDQVIDADGVATFSCAASSAGGTTPAQSVTVKRDATAPQLTVTGGPAAGGTYNFGEVPAAPSCEATDALSGVAGSCVVVGYSSAVGERTVTVTATDVAGNTATETRSYTVEPWVLTGFYAPVDMGDSKVNTVKGGSTVPLKFEAFSGPTELTDVAAVKSFTQKVVSCSTGAVEDEVEFVTTGATTLRYDLTGGQFVQNWQTPKKPGTCHQVTVTLQDGTSTKADFRLK